MSLLTGALTMGCILALMALGVFLTFRIFGFADLATDSVLTLGAATAAVLLTRGVPPVPATLAATGAGMLAGCVTGALHTRLTINNVGTGTITASSDEHHKVWIVDREPSDPRMCGGAIA